jgi:hypothetical protein
VLALRATKFCLNSYDRQRICRTAKTLRPEVEASTRSLNVYMRGFVVCMYVLCVMFGLDNYKK